ncbi:hypothetical protein [Trueperella bialowiezensis]|uniref:Uncharacterized protein n=1 Tax=Trueperella bialowiezensis TaxID=312285 RepID=A0A3S4X6M8_9ACTO|nr:hypothetical protein [Trueperella bialowiezensis]VEI13807.1 Uncharacterised protein [Trueperella bialowiezensis]
MEFTYDDYGDTALYDVFYEAGTYYGGVLVALSDQAEAQGDHQRERELLNARIALRRERANVHPDDRASQIACIEKWHARANAAREDLLQPST